jgi:hypothetical protein
MIEQLVEDDGEKLARKLIERALKGDVRCLQYCMDRLWPKRQGRPLDVQLPKINGVQDIPPVMVAINDGVSNGEVTAEEAWLLARSLDTYRDAIIANDFAVRLQKVEAAVNKQMKKSNNHN